MNRPYYEIWKSVADYSRDDYRFPFIEVNVKKKLMEIPTFYFTIPKDGHALLNAPAVGDRIRIYRNYGELLRGKILKMEVREDTIYYEGVSIADDWNYIDSDYLSWKMVDVSVILNRFAQDIGWTLGQVDPVLISKFDYDYAPYYENLQRLANWVQKEFAFDEINKQLHFKTTVGVDRSADIRFKRGVNLEAISVKKEQDETWDKVIALGAGEGRNQLKAVRGTGTRVKVFTDKSIKTQADLDKFADEKLAEGNKPLYVYYEAEVFPPLFNFDVGDTVWVEDEENYINEPMRVMEYSLTFNETEQIDIVLANKKKTLVDFFKNMEKGQRTLANVHHSSAVQASSMIVVDEDYNPIQINVADNELVNTTSGNTIGAIENKANSAESIALSAQTDATNAQTTASQALTQASSAQTMADQAQSTASIAQTKVQNLFSASPNLINNGYDSFEQIPNGEPFAEGGTTDYCKVEVTSYSLDGKRSLRLRGAGSNNIGYLAPIGQPDPRIFPVTEGATYVASCWVINPNQTATNTKMAVITGNPTTDPSGTNNQLFYSQTLTNFNKDEGWQRLWVKFTVPTGHTHMGFQIEHDGNAISNWFDCFKLEKVDPNTTDPTPWTPATISSIDATNITTGYLSFDRARGGTLLIGGSNNQNGRFLLYNALGETVADFDGANNLVTFDTLQVGTIISDSVTSYGSLNKTIYVDFVNGNDEIPSSQNSSSSPYKSIARALMDVPKFNNGTITIYIMNSGTESVLLWGPAGGGVVTFDFQGYTLNGYFGIFGSTNIVKIQNATIHWTGDSNYAIVKAFRSKLVSISNCTLWGRGQATHGFMVSDGSVGTIDSSIVQDCVTNNVIAQYGSVLNIINTTGKGAQYGVTASYGSIVGGSGNAPTGTTSYREIYGGKIQATLTYTASNYNPTGTVDQIGTWTATSADSWRTVYNSWRGDNTVRQGQWTDSGGSYGLHTGLWFFGTAPSTTVTGKTIKSMRILVKRKSTGGYGGDVTVYFRNHNYTSKPSGQPSVSSYYTTATFKAGDEKWVNLPSSFFADWQNGVAKGIAIYTSNSTNSYYAIFEPTATLEITYV